MISFSFSGNLLIKKDDEIKELQQTITHLSSVQVTQNELMNDNELINQSLMNELYINGTSWDNFNFNVCGVLQLRLYALISIIFSLKIYQLTVFLLIIGFMLFVSDFRLA